MLTTVLILLTLGVIGFIQDRRTQLARWDMLRWFGFVLAMIFLFVWVSVFEDTMVEIQRFKAIASTVESARARGDDIERTAMAMSVIEANTWLAEKQYRNTTFWERAYPDEVDDLEPIE